MAAAATGLLGSYKAKLVFVFALMGLVPVGFAFVLVLKGKAAFDDFLNLTKWIYGTIGVTSVLPAIGGRALEGYAEKRDVTPSNIVAGSIGKVDTVRPPPPAGAKPTLLERLPQPFPPDDNDDGRDGWRP